MHEFLKLIRTGGDIFHMVQDIGACEAVLPANFSACQYLLRNSVTLLWFVPCLWMISRFALKNCREKCKYYMWLLPLTGFLLPIRFQVVVFLRLPEEKRRAVPYFGTGAFNRSAMEWLGMGIWISGVLMFLILSLIRHVRFERMVSRWEQDFACHDLEERFEMIKKRYRISRQIQLKICPCIHTPMTVHFFHPAILLPFETCSEKEFDDIVSHELMHIKRMDICYKTLVFLFLAVYWFHPCAYWMAGEMKSLCETSCDEAILKGSGKAERANYARMLIRIASENCSEAETISGIGLFSGKENLKRRMMSVMSEEKKNHRGIVLIALMGSVVCIGMTVQVEYQEHAGAKRLSELNICEQKAEEDIERDIQKDARKTGDDKAERMPETRKADRKTELVFAYQTNENTIMEIRDMTDFRNHCFAAEGYAMVLY